MKHQATKMELNQSWLSCIQEPKKLWRCSCIKLQGSTPDRFANNISRQCSIPSGGMYWSAVTLACNQKQSWKKPPLFNRASSQSVSKHSPSKFIQTTEDLLIVLYVHVLFYFLHLPFICFSLFFFSPLFVNHLGSLMTLPWPNTQPCGVGITSALHDPAGITSALCSGTSVSGHCCGGGFGQTDFQLLCWNKPMNDSIFWHAWSTLGGCTLLAKAEVWSIL